MCLQRIVKYSSLGLITHQIKSCSPYLTTTLGSEENPESGLALANSALL